ncbi:MAG TPA: PDZ domain-containing protein [Gemmataceae bacterium]|nr:PDZ domain-containing protein [Gemmataceae bacterium]
MKRQMTFAIAALFLFAGWSLAEDDKPFKVPFETLKTQHIVIMVKLNGKGPYRLIFDTGAPTSIINNKIAKDSGVIAKDAKLANGGLLGPVATNAIKTLEVGELKATNISTIVADHPTVTLMDKALGPVEGIIGLSLFGKYKMTIDYQAKEMTFVPSDFTPPDMMKSVMAMLTNPSPAKKVVAPAGQWGFSVTKDAKDTDAGVSVKEVFAGGAAAAAGLKAGDRLLTLDGRWTDTVADCYQAASAVRPGMTARLVVLREGKEVELTVKVATGL